MELMRIDPGAFTMGSPADEQGRADDETQHRVEITRPFYMGITEVTQEQYEAITGINPSATRSPKNPVNGVSWHSARQFCDALSGRTSRAVRLPTEAEWEYACRAGTATAFHTGLTISADKANYDGSFAYASGAKGLNREKALAVGSLGSNAWGLHDMHGKLCKRILHPASR